MCWYGRFGVAGRAVRDVPQLATGFVGALLVAACTVLVGFSLVSVGAFVVGTLTGLVLLAVWGITPWGRWRHWRANILGRDHPDLEEPLPKGVHSAFVLVSMHPHWVCRSRCIVTDPEGNEHTHEPSSAEGTDGEVEIKAMTASGMGTGGISTYPLDLGAPPPASGRYSVRWELTVEGRRRPVVVSRHRWKVTV